MNWLGTAMTWFTMIALIGVVSFITVDMFWEWLRR